MYSLQTYVSSLAVRKRIRLVEFDHPGATNVAWQAPLRGGAQSVEQSDVYVVIIIEINVMGELIRMGVVKFEGAR